jgi:asparaginyl-tRNA synthetase
MEIKGWVYKKRVHKDIIFLDIRNTDGITQCVIKRENVTKDLWDIASNLTQESSLIIYGDKKEEQRAPGGYEIIVEKINPVNIAMSPYPLAKKEHSPEFLMEKRHLTLRSPRYQAIMKVRHGIMKAFRDYFTENNWFEISPPIITSSAAEGGATLFEIDYFGQKAYLTQSWQLYAEAILPSLERIFTIAPSFRAEKSRTRRHLCEFYHAEAEAAWIGLEDLFKIEEGVIENICSYVSEKYKKELEFLGREPSEIAKIKGPFRKISYFEALQILREKGKAISYGEDLGADEERLLTQDLSKPIFIHSYPLEIRAFYVKEDPSNPTIGRTTDLLAPEGYGEISTGGEREDNIDKLIKRLQNQNLNIKNYEWYLDLRRYGSVPHAGFGLGIDRMTMWLCKLDHIRDAIPFPRLERSLYFI